MIALGNVIENLKDDLMLGFKMVRDGTHLISLEKIKSKTQTNKINAEKKAEMPNNADNLPFVWMVVTYYFIMYRIILYYVMLRDAKIYLSRAVPKNP